ncbi:hypothetical protein [Streptomyces sp. Qhu-G9]|uniref:hypothetical protein n=1 Tax=Streptomyces sp. Qhu-G9 TaxID=3452799 RepID=UPI003AF693B6
MSGIKRHLLVDTCGTVLAACVSPASVGDRGGAAVLFSQAADAFPRLRRVWADPGYPRCRLPCLGPGSHRHHRAGRAAPRRRIPLGLGEGRDTASGRAPLRSGLATLGGRADHRLAGTVPRLSKDFEYLSVCSENAIYLTMAMLLARRLARPARWQAFQTSSSLYLRSVVRCSRLGA